MGEADKLMALCAGARAISPGLEVKVVASSDDPEKWSVVVSVSSVILIWTEYASLDTALDSALRKLTNMSQRTLAAVEAHKE